MTEAQVELVARIDGADVVKGLNNNDEMILAFIIETLESADSLELRERLAERLNSWNEEHAK